MEAGLVSDEQAARIVEFEEGRDRPWVLYGIVGIGVVAIATGIISVVAANWWAIPATLKLAGYFLLQAALGVAVVRTDSRPGVWRDACLLLFALSFLAGIGLVGQIYNLAGAGWKALLFWAVLSFSPTLRAHGALLPRLWVAAVLFAAFSWAIDGGSAGGDKRAVLASAVPALLCAGGFLLQRYDMLSFALRYAIAQAGVGSFLLFCALGGNLLWSQSRLPLNDDLVPYLAVPWLAVLLAAAASVAREPKVPRLVARLTAALFVYSALFVTIPLLLAVRELMPEILARLIGAAGFLKIAALAATIAALAGFRRLYDVASFLIAARLVWAYFEVFGSLAQTGAGLIVSGVIILGIAYVWQRRRAAIAAWLGRKR